MESLVLRGTVVKGDGRGRQLGFPTANIQVGDSRLPDYGVYLVEVEREGFRPRRAVCNVGVRPTIAGSQGVFVEVHIPGFDGDLYGQTLTVRILRKLRGEKKFASLDALKAQIARDIASAEAD